MSYEPSVIVAHEHYPARGGGEVVADELGRVFDSPIVTGWIKDRSLSEQDPIEILERTPLNAFRRFFTNPLVRDPFYMFAFETVPTLRQYDVVIQSGNAPTWYVPGDDQTVIKYNHSPPRNPFDLFYRVDTANTLDYINPGYVVNRLYLKAARQLWKNRVTEVDHWVCNSELVAKRTRRYLGVPEEKISVVYPPVAVSDYEPMVGGGYYVALSRMEPSKQFDYIIEEFHHLNKGAGNYKLIIAGDGNIRPQLERLAGDADYIEFAGFVPEDEKRHLLQGATASIFAAENEDFGIVPIESMAAGTPVIGVNEGFTRYQIREGLNGMLFERASGKLYDAVKEYERDGVRFDANELHEFARQFDRQTFAEKMRSVVEKTVAETTIGEAETQVKFRGKTPV